MSIQSEIETRMREAISQMNYLLEQGGMKALWFSTVKDLRDMFLPDDFSKLSWDFIRQMKDQFTLRDWNAIWNYHTTHENEEREFRWYFEQGGNRFFGYPNSYEYNQKELYKNRYGKELF